MPAREPTFEDYLTAIERQLARRRGRELRLSPPDFKLARQWFGAGLKLGTVLAGIDAANAGPALPRTLQACRRAVERLAAPGAPRAVETRPPALDATDADGLSRLAQRLGMLKADASAFVNVAREAQGLLAAGAPSAAELDRLRARVEQAAVAALAADERERLLRSAQRGLARQAPGLDAAGRAAALERHLARRALERFGLLGLV